MIKKTSSSIINEESSDTRREGRELVSLEGDEKVRRVLRKRYEQNKNCYLGDQNKGTKENLLGNPSRMRTKKEKQPMTPLQTIFLDSKIVARSLEAREAKV